MAEKHSKYAIKLTPRRYSPFNFGVKLRSAGNTIGELEKVFHQTEREERTKEFHCKGRNVAPMILESDVTGSYVEFNAFYRYLSVQKLIQEE